MTQITLARTGVLLLVHASWASDGIGFGAQTLRRLLARTQERSRSSPSRGAKFPIELSTAAGRTTTAKRSAIVVNALALIFLIGLCAPNAWATDRYVSGSGSGSACTKAAPCRQIYVAAALAGPSDVIHIGDGVYEGGFQTVKAGAPGNPITYKAESKWSAVIAAQKSGGSSSFGWDQRGDYVVIDGVAMNGGSASWYIGIYNSGKGSIVQNTHVADIASHGGCPSSGGAGIEGEGYWGDDQIQVLNNVIERIGPSSVRCITVHGIYITGKSMKAQGNVIRQPSGWCISSYHNTSDNDFSNNTCDNSHYGCYSVGVQRGYANYNSIMSYNNCQSCGQYGYNNYNREGPVVNLRVVNNQVSKCPSPWALNGTPHTP